MKFRRRRRNRGSSVPEQWIEERAQNLFTYEMLMQREMEQDAMLWETPTLALTAQAFLLTIALNNESAPAAVYVSAGLGVLVAFLSMQLMAKHRFLSEMDRAEMHRLEEALGIPHMSRRNYFFQDGKYVIPPTLQIRSRMAPKKQGLLERASSYKVWIRGLALFAAVNLAILATELFWPFILHPVTP